MTDTGTINNRYWEEGWSNGYDGIMRDNPYPVNSFAWREYAQGRRAGETAYRDVQKAERNE